MSVGNSMADWLYEYEQPLRERVQVAEERRDTALAENARLRGLLRDIEAAVGAYYAPGSTKGAFETIRAIRAALAQMGDLIRSVTAAGDAGALQRWLHEHGIHPEPDPAQAAVEAARAFVAERRAPVLDHTLLIYGGEAATRYFAPQQHLFVAAFSAEARRLLTAPPTPAQGPLCILCGGAVVINLAGTPHCSVCKRFTPLAQFTTPAQDAEEE